jgi:hypothetical protein
MNKGEFSQYCHDTLQQETFRGLNNIAHLDELSLPELITEFADAQYQENGSEITPDSLKSSFFSFILKKIQNLPQVTNSDSVD